MIWQVVACTVCSRLSDIGNKKNKLGANVNLKQAGPWSSLHFLHVLSSPWCFQYFTVLSWGLEQARVMWSNPTCFCNYKFGLCFCSCKGKSLQLPSADTKRRIKTPEILLAYYLMLNSVILIHSFIFLKLKKKCRLRHWSCRLDRDILPWLATPCDVP